jgi:hypothetical protein
MQALKIGYAQVSTDEQDLSAQLAVLAELGVGEERIYVDKGLTGANRARPGLREALAACRAGDQSVVTKLDRLARSVSDAGGHRGGGGGRRGRTGSVRSGRQQRDRDAVMVLVEERDRGLAELEGRGSRPAVSARTAPAAQAAVICGLPACTASRVSSNSIGRLLANRTLTTPPHTRFK